MTTNEQILDAYIRHQTYILRYAGGLRNEVTPYLAATEPKLMDLILAHVAMADRTLTGAKGRKWQSEFEKALHNLRDPAWGKVSDKVMKELREFAVNEAAAGAATIEGAVPVVLSMSMPPAAQLVSIVNSQPFEGKVLKKWLEKSAFADVERISRAAKVGIVQGETPTQIARTIIGPRNVAGKYNNSVAQKAFRDIESVLLTVTNGIQQEAKQALYAANADIVKDELFVATLDSRTTVECMGYDTIGHYPRGEGPMPPCHFRCRSTRVAVMDAKNLGDRPFVAVSEKQLLRDYTKKNNLTKVTKRKDLPYGHKVKFDKFKRAELPKYVGTVPATTSYNTWLKGQTKEFQTDVLGKSRADMFRKGDISLDRFTARNGSTLTLDQLKKRGVASAARAAPPTYTPPKYTPAKTIKEARQKIIDEKVALVSDFRKDVNLDGLNEAIKSNINMNDRFNLKPLNYIGDTRNHSNSQIKDYFYSGNGKRASAGFRSAYNADGSFEFEDIIINPKTLDMKDFAKVKKYQNSTVYKHDGIDYYDPIKKYNKLEKSKRSSYVLDKIKEDYGSDGQGWRWTVARETRDTINHEIGHRIHANYYDALDDLVWDAKDRGWDLLTGAYGASRPTEFMAEVMSMYMNNQFDRIYPPLLKAIRKLDKGAL